MELVTALVDLQEESSCPICLEYLKDPVTISCGHNFCHSCLSVSWKDLDDTFPCPVCRFCFPYGNFRRNPQLRSLTEIAKLLQVRRSKRKRQKEKAVCDKHDQFLTLFCVKNLEMLCAQCSLSAEHQKHYISPLDKAASHHRETLERSVEPLKNNIERVEKVIALQGSKSVELTKQVECKREAISSEFEGIRLFLQNEQETILREIQDEETDILTKLNENLVMFSDVVSTLKHLLREIEGTCVQSDVELLACVKSIYRRYQTLKHPETFSFSLTKYGFRLPPQYSGLHRVIKAFQADVILDVDTAHLQLIVSEDRRAVRYGRTKQKGGCHARRFELCPAVLGCQRFSAGRHYWEVDVGRKPKWILGVCQDGVARSWQDQPSVLGGFWAVGRYMRGGYVASGPKRAHLLPAVRPSKVGIFLDCDLGEVSFYNMNDRSVLYTFSDSFTEAVWPYFYTGTDSEPLKICSVSDSER
ncbi:tripartite motif-containing protein 60-like [Lemur catta]|uniref:tripartite motif-containing protein 60 n=1 Tax=Lemur catta TaxID=9447 RepID=UPI001E26AEB1|nr:tripartite motif-containing protein 60 [Lemur catta]XP_045408509.1 tripartite motif-containing protein 60 [Lemur catta]XP_045408511.1 tripartite motif-containing protein 60-like [Lemur catta]XP_045408512.1 tripartite motif-containing protein 60-like [Lemur catta]XP_045408513.1 tripartite motif-containing protein 60-like [Lemur catta]